MLPQSLKASTTSKKGQTTVSSEIREKLNLKEGDLLLFELLDNGEVRLSKSPSYKDLDYLKSVEKMLASEWMGDDDDDL
jgi:AbrB family looped-hinge helix DNA binding protein